MTAELHQLRDDVRGVTREVRDTLYDLRTDVTEDLGLGEVLEQFVRRVISRSELQIQVDADRSARLPMLQEREMWRIAQEALATSNAMRTPPRCGWSGAATATRPHRHHRQRRRLRPAASGSSRLLRRAGHAGTGLEHRATLEIVSAPGRGTRVRCTSCRPRCTTTAPPGPTPLGRSATQRHRSARTSWTTDLRDWEQPMTIRLMLADDHRMLREGLRRSMTDAGFEVIGEAATGSRRSRWPASCCPTSSSWTSPCPTATAVEAAAYSRPTAPRVGS